MSFAVSCGGQDEPFIEEQGSTVQPCVLPQSDLQSYLCQSRTPF
ncbi:MAG: hypothetical protein OXB86_06540 [Bdellovibrionales bacterium]|nr:hypothetical protein [Bdellovibrionales bacterium]